MSRFGPATAAHLVPEAASLSVNAKRSVNSDPNFPAYSLSVPVDHFHNESMYEPHSNETFKLHYWINTEHYKPGGPVIVIASGEAGGDGRVPFLQDGIAGILTKGTHGIGVVLEHRYYGQSWPTKDLSTKSLRFLTTDQALADTAYFAQHATFKGLEDHNLTAANTPWIIYGGSYAGGFAVCIPLTSITMNKWKLTIRRH
ncbi:hypothetical protein KEM55_005396 [Ascosphaera atra]|nr:hypothetical protein KEM55_005396 [Ascosphaera atra]